MAADEDWTEAELQAAVAAYLEMLRLEQSQTPYSKTEFRKRLLASALANRTDKAVEFRMQNISYVMETLGLPRIANYQPANHVGPTNEARLRQIINDIGGTTQGLKTPSRLSDIVTGPEAVMGVKAVFGMIGSHVLCFGARGSLNDKSAYSVAAGAARRAVRSPFVVTIGGGKEVRDGLAGRVLNVARVALVYGPTSALVTDPDEVARLAQWPVAIALHDVWRFVDVPHLVEDLGFPDRTILAAAQDGIVRPDESMKQLWAALRDRPVERVALPLPGNFYDSGQPKLIGTKLPTIPASAGKEEGARVWKLQQEIERDRTLAQEAKRLNVERYGIMTCEACEFSHSDSAMFDAHHPTPLAVGTRTTLPEHLQILCPTCHRRAHRKRPLDPFQLHELRAWVAAGRP